MKKLNYIISYVCIVLIVVFAFIFILRINKSDEDILPDNETGYVQEIDEVSDVETISASEERFIPQVSEVSSEEE